MRRRKAKFGVPLAVVSAAAIAASGGLASADSTQNREQVHVYEADTELAGNVGTVILTGAITDYGQDHQGVAGNGNYNELALHKGSFEVDLSHLGPKLQFPTNPKTCSSDGSARAEVPIVPGSGTGAYQGITGRFMISASVASLDCGTTEPQPPGVLIARGSGSVSYK